MVTTIKGIYKGLKFISQIFVVKERELEIGYPTDVKHVAHIGWDSPSGNAPSWMNAFKTPDFSTSFGNMGERRDSSPMSTSNWLSQDVERSADHQQSVMFRDMPQDLPNAPNKHKQKNTKSTSSPKSSPWNTRSSRATKSKATHHGREAPPDLLL